MDIYFLIYPVVTVNILLLLGINLHLLLTPFLLTGLQNTGRNFSLFLVLVTGYGGGDNANDRQEAGDTE